MPWGSDMKILISLIIIFFIPVIGFSGITFTNGYWSTTFDASGDYNFCDEGDCVPSWFDGGTIRWTCCAQPGTTPDTTEVLTSENYSGGDGGGGLALYVCDAGACITDPAGLYFAATRYIWVRWYLKIPANVDYPGSAKFLYIEDAAAVHGKMAIKIDMPNETVRAEGGGGGFGQPGTMTSLTDFDDIFGGNN